MTQPQNVSIKNVKLPRSDEIVVVNRGYKQLMIITPDDVQSDIWMINVRIWTRHETYDEQFKGLEILRQDFWNTIDLYGVV